MKILLKGYFDSNFGDDYIMKIIVSQMPDIEFVIDSRNPHTQFLSEEANVSITDDIDKNLPILIVTGSGFMINTPAALKCELKWFLRKAHIGDYCMGCNIEPFDSRFKEFLIKKKLQKFKLIICRDKKSYKWLSCAGLNKTSIYCLSDILFSLPQEWLKEQIDPDKLGISMFHRIGDKEDCVYYRTMAKAADYWVEQTGNGVYLMAFDTGKENDEFACRQVKKMMKHSDMAEIILHGNNGEIINAYSECKKIIGARFHSSVLAMRMNIDVFPLIFREKMQRLIDETEYPVKGCNIDAIDYEKIKHFLDGPGTGFSVSSEIIQSANMYPRIFRSECGT